MNTFVLDSSVALSWCFEDEATPGTDELLRSLSSRDAVAPSLWPFEVANVLAMSERKGRITNVDVDRAIVLIESLGVRIDKDGHARAFDEVLKSARTYELTVYDAAFLELAIRLGVPLATRDQALRHAATRTGVLLIEV